MNGQGFTLNELLLSTAILAALATAAFPSLQRQLTSWQISSIQNDLHHGLLLARQAAITHGKPVIVRSIDNDWNNGWQVFVDSDNDTWRGAGEPLLTSHIQLPGQISLTSNFGQYARYRSSGFTSYASGAFMAGTWRLCSHLLPEGGRKLVMSYGGRVRHGRPGERACSN